MAAPLQRVVVEGDDDPVPGDVGVRLEVAVAERDRRAERLERVLGRLRRAAAVGDRDGRPLGEERVRGHRRDTTPCMDSRPPICPTCGQPASEALGGPDHDWECRNEACPEFGQPVAADERSVDEPGPPGR